MGFIIDSIIKKELVGTRQGLDTSFETINFTGASDSVDATATEQGFLILVAYTNGVGINATFRVEGSADNQAFAPIPGLEKVVTDATGSIVFDAININANYVRLSWEITSGSVDIFSNFSGKARH